MDFAEITGRTLSLLLHPEHTATFYNYLYSGWNSRTKAKSFTTFSKCCSDADKLRWIQCFGYLLSRESRALLQEQCHLLDQTHLETRNIPSLPLLQQFLSCRIKEVIPLFVFPSLRLSLRLNVPPPFATLLQKARAHLSISARGLHNKCPFLPATYKEPHWASRGGVRGLHTCTVFLSDKWSTNQMYTKWV